MTTSEPNRYYTIREIADLFGCSHTTVYRMLRESGARVLRLSKQLRVESTEVQALIDLHTENF